MKKRERKLRLSYAKLWNYKNQAVLGPLHVNLLGYVAGPARIEIARVNCLAHEHYSKTLDSTLNSRFLLDSHASNDRDHSCDLLIYSILASRNKFVYNVLAHLQC